MQGQGSTIDSFSEPVNIDQGSISNNTNMNQQTSLNSILHPMESRLSNYAVASGGTTTCVNDVTHNVQNSSSWNLGEPSSRLSSQTQKNDDEMKMEHGWSASCSARTGDGPRSEEMQFEPTNILFPDRRNIGHVDRSGLSFSQGSSSSHVPQNLNLNAGYVGNTGDGGQSMGISLGPNLCNSDGLEAEQAYMASASFDKVGTSSGSSGFMAEENDGETGSSMGGWGLSCKRKALEGTSAQSCSAGSSNCFPQAENGVSAHYDASSSLSLSPPTRNYPIVCPPEPSNPRFGIGMRLVEDGFPSGIIGNTENHMRSFGRRGDPRRQQESVPFNLSSIRSSGHSNIASPHPPPIPLPFSDALELRSAAAVAANTNASQNQRHGLHVSAFSRDMHPFPWGGASGSRSGNFPSSFISGETTATLREEGNTRSIRRNNAEHLMFFPSAEMRNVVQDPTSWGLATRRASRGVSSTTQIGSSSSTHPSPASAWVPHHNPSTHSQQRSSDFSPWSLFPSVEFDSGGHAGHFPPLSSGPSSSQESLMPSSSNSHVHHQPQRRSSFLMERQGDDVLGLPHSLQALAADIEGRHRLISEIRQVLSAMRRGENLRIEDYMLFEPFVYHGLAEMHDRHRDMRLDVDNMSYEELLALEERIGDVSTGLSDETILKIMKQKKYMSFEIETLSSDQEPCCICQEEYADGDDLGMLDCGHDFHTDCIKQWLMQKNLCPVCKTTALRT